MDWRSHGGGGGRANIIEEVNAALLELPPVETLDPAQLKLFNPNQLRFYIESEGLEPETSKPGMKRQIREIIARKINPKLASFPASSPFRTPSMVANSHFKNNILPQPHSPSPKTSSLPQTPNTGDELNCFECNARKLNKFCDYKLCRSCCRKNGYKCWTHRKERKKGEKGENTPSSSKPSSISSSSVSNIQKTASFSAGSRIPGMVPGIPGMGMMGIPGVMPGGPGLPLLPLPPQFLSSLPMIPPPLPPPSETRPIIKTLSCPDPECDLEFPAVGSELWIHVATYHPPLFQDFIYGRKLENRTRKHKRKTTEDRFSPSTDASISSAMKRRRKEKQPEDEGDSSSMDIEEGERNSNEVKIADNETNNHGEDEEDEVDETDDEEDEEEVEEMELNRREKLEDLEAQKRNLRAVNGEDVESTIAIFEKRARLNALKKLGKNAEALCDLFALHPLDDDVDELEKQVRSGYNRRKVFNEALSEKLKGRKEEEREEEEKHTAALEKHKWEASNFESELQKLEHCETLEDVEQCKGQFEKEHNVLFLPLLPSTSVPIVQIPSSLIQQNCSNQGHETSPKELTTKHYIKL